MSAKKQTEVVMSDLEEEEQPVEQGWLASGQDPLCQSIGKSLPALLLSQLI